MPFDYSGFSDELRGHADGLGEVKLDRPFATCVLEALGSSVPYTFDLREWNRGRVGRIETHDSAAVSIQHGQVAECQQEVVLYDVGNFDKARTRAGLL